MKKWKPNEFRSNYTYWNALK